MKAADLFCGAGGTSIGAEQSGAAKVCFAVNHWDVAVKTHAANFPDATHINSRLDQVKPSECPQMDLLFASPECTHHSRARGGKPTSDQQRAGAWELLPWIEYHRPTNLVVENVIEFADWGPIGDNGKPLKRYKGKFFDAWLMAIRAAGYRVDFQRLNAADFGAATSRTRLFVIARKGNRSARFPEPSHTRRPSATLPGISSLLPWRPAYEVIDWSLPCPSIFSRKRPLADKTLARIEAGLRRFVEPFVVRFRNHMDGSAIGAPIGTLTCAGGHHGIAVPYTVPNEGFYRGNQPRSINDPIPTIVAGRGAGGVAIPITCSTHQGAVYRGVDQPVASIRTKGGSWVAVPYVFHLTHGGARNGHGVDGPLPTITTANRGELGIALPFLTPFLGEAPGQTPRTHGAGDPVPTIATSNPKGLAVPFFCGCGARDGQSAPTGAESPLNTIVTKDAKCLAVPFVCQHYSNGGQWSAIESPLPTIPTVDRHGLTLAVIEPCCLNWPEPTSDAMRSLQSTMRELGVFDIGFRMLANHELSAAQGFPGDYIFHGTKSDITRQIGNSVSPPVAKAITEAIAA